MDPDGALDTRPKPNAWDIANLFLGQMGRRFTMARDWQQKLKTVYKYYQDERAKYKKAGGDVGGSPQSSTSEGGGGLKDYVQFFEKSHKEFGLNDDNLQIDDKDVDMTDVKLQHDDESVDRTEGASTVELKSETGDSSEGVPAQTVPVSPGFTPVNARATALKPISVHDMNSLPKTPPTPYGPQILNQHTPAVSPYSFTSHTPSYISPTTHTYSYSTHSTHHNMSATRNGTESSQVQMFPSGSGPIQAGTAYSSWPEAKAMIEHQGAQSIHNDFDLGIMAMGDGGELAFPTERAYQHNDNNNNNNAAYYPQYFGPPTYWK